MTPALRRRWRALAAAALLAASAALLSAGCAASRPVHTAEAARDDAAVAALQDRLRALSRDADPDEARRVAKTAVADSLRLAAEYRVAGPARWHNLLIQMGFRDRGLCFHWTEDLMKGLAALDLKTFRLHWGVAHRGSDLREHNSVVITALNQAFADGLVLDPWRNSGELYWTAVRQDDYPWVPLPPDQW